MSLADNNYCYFEDRNADEVKYDQYPAPPSNPDFMVHIHAIHTIVPVEILEQEEEEQGMLSDAYITKTFNKSFNTQSDLLIHEDDASCASNISHMLSEVDVPEDAHEDFITQITIAARRISVAANLNGISSSCLTMDVHIGVVVIEGSEDLEDVNNNERELLGANKAAVEALEKVIVKEGDVLHDCAICLEVIRVGSEGTRLPCSHMFHGGCILCWLGKSKLCPYCRFEMP